MKNLQLTTVLACVLLAGLHASAAPLDPDDGSVSGNLTVWLKDVATNYSNTAAAGDGVWSDSSGGGNDVSSADDVRVDADSQWLVSERGGQLTDPTTSSVALTGGAFTALHFQADQDADDNGQEDTIELLATAAPGSDGVGLGITNLTMFTVYSIPADADTGAKVRPAGMGAQRFEHDPDRPDSSSNNFNLQIDGTIRKDNGSIGGAPANPTGEFFIRIDRMGSDVDQWYHLEDGVLSQNINGGTSFTPTDYLALGDIGHSSGEMSFDILEVILYNAALTDEQVSGIDEYLYTKYFIIPEPASLVLLALGGIVVLRRHRR